MVVSDAKVLFFSEVTKSLQREFIRKVFDGYRDTLARWVVFDIKLHKWNYLINYAGSFYFF